MAAVSVVIPAYNRAHLVPRALKSVLRQTFDDLEVIVVDDGSTDDLVSTMRKFDDPRVRTVVHKERMGGTAARNTGIQNATAELVAFLDSDDQWVNDKLEKQMEALKRENDTCRPLIVFSKSRRDWEPVQTMSDERWASMTGEDLRLGLLGSARISVRVHWSTMLAPREELVRIGGFDPDLPATQWWDLVYRLTGRCDFLLGPEPLLVQYDPQGDRVRQVANIGLAAEILLTKHDMSIPEARVTRSHMLTSSAIYRMSLGEYFHPLKSLTAAFITRPGLRTAARVGGALLGGRMFFKLQGLLGRKTTGARNGVNSFSNPSAAAAPASDQSRTRR